MIQLPVEQIKESKWVATDALQMAIGTAGGVLISIAVMLNTFGNVSTQVLVKARTWYAMAKDGLFFKSFAKIHPKYKTPNIALLVQGIWATVLLIGAAFAESAYEAMIDFFSFTSTVFNIMTFASVWILRRKFPDVHRPYRAWGYPVTLFLVLIIQIWFLITTLITAFIPSMIGVVLTCSGLLYYFRDDIKQYFTG